MREAMPADVEVIVRHRRQMFFDMGHTDEDNLRAMEATTRPLLQEWLTSGNYRGWLVSDEGGAVVAGGGVIVVPMLSRPQNPDPQLVYILNIYVDPPYRRRGLARAIMERMIAWCGEQGFKSVALHASDQGRTLYEQLGFKPTNEMRLTL